MSDILQPVMLGGSREADVSALSTELDALWRSPGEDSAGHDAVTRACALTLLVYTESEEGAHEVSDLVGTLTLQNPCRAVIMVVQPDQSPAGLSARVAAVCQLPAPGEKQVCCEHVTLVARGDRVNDLDKVVVPLMVSGLPVCLWWRAGHLAPLDYFGKMLRYIDRVYMDSEQFPQPGLELSALAQRIQKSSGQIVFTDLNWARITPWRELTAGCFDSEEARRCLDRVNEVRIEYSAGGSGKNSCLGQGLLFTAWLAGRLGWKPIALTPGEKDEEGDLKGKRSYHFQGEQGEIHVQLDPQPSGAECYSGFLSVSLNVVGDSPAKFSLRCGASRKCVLTHVEIPGHPPVEQTVHLDVFDEIGLLNEELKFSRRDGVYEESLAVITSMTF